MSKVLKVLKMLKVLGVIGVLEPLETSARLGMPGSFDGVREPDSSGCSCRVRLRRPER